MQRDLIYLDCLLSILPSMQAGRQAEADRGRQAGLQPACAVLTIRLNWGYAVTKLND